MSDVAAARRPAGRVFRATRTPAFRALFVIACGFTVPVLLLGVLFSLIAVVDGGASGAPGVGLALAAPTAAGVAGMLGLARSRAHSSGSSVGQIELTQVLLVIGIVAALSMTGLVVAATMEDMRLSTGESTLMIVVAAPLIVLSVDGLGRLEYLLGLVADRTGQAADGLPFLFLSVALGLCVCVALIMPGL